MIASNDKKAAIAELLKDFSVRRTFRLAGRACGTTPHAAPVSLDSYPALPYSAVSEIWGCASSGKTSLMLAYFAQATTRSELCALIDGCDAFDPVSGRNCGIDLKHLLWVKCSGRIETALKISDMLLQGGGFGLTALDLGDIGPATLRKIPMMYWHRFRLAAEKNRTAFLVVASGHITGSCASLVMAGMPGTTRWSGQGRFWVLESLQPRFEVTRSEDFKGGKGFSVELKHHCGNCI